MIEVGVALIAICLPLFRPGQLLRKNHWIQRWLGSFSSKLSRSRRSTHSSRGQSAHEGRRSKHIPLASSEDEINKSFRKSTNSNIDYRIAMESTQDTELVEQDFQNRYEQFFPGSATSIKADPTHMV